MTVRNSKVDNLRKDIKELYSSRGIYISQNEACVILLDTLDSNSGTLISEIQCFLDVLGDKRNKNTLDIISKERELRNIQKECEHSWEEDEWRKYCVCRVCGEIEDR